MKKEEMKKEEMKKERKKKRRKEEKEGHRHQSFPKNLGFAAERKEEGREESGDPGWNPLIFQTKPS